MLSLNKCKCTCTRPLSSTRSMPTKARTGSPTTACTSVRYWLRKTLTGRCQTNVSIARRLQGEQRDTPSALTVCRRTTLGRDAPTIRTRYSWGGSRALRRPKQDRVQALSLESGWLRQQPCVHSNPARPECL